jgi:DNA-3-methyladenine glycosylase II
MTLPKLARKKANSNPRSNGEGTDITALIPIPTTYHYRDILRFHARDKSALSELVDDVSLRKGVMLDGVPSQISLTFQAGQARFQLHADGELRRSEAELCCMGERMLGMSFNAPDFERAMQADPQLGRLVQAQAGLNIPVLPTVFEALIWAITGQQLTVTFAVQCRRRLIELANVRHSQGLLCHPDAQTLTSITEPQLCELQFSRAKAATILRVAHLVVDGELKLESWPEQLAQDPTSIDAMVAQLLAIKGIGPWTVNYALMRGLGYADCSLHGDVAVRSAIQALLKSEEKISQSAAEQWLAQYTPWRSLVAAHLWASRSLTA